MVLSEVLKDMPKMPIHLEGTSFLAWVRGDLSLRRSASRSPPLRMGEVRRGFPCRSRSWFRPLEPDRLRERDLLLDTDREDILSYLSYFSC